MGYRRLFAQHAKGGCLGGDNRLCGGMENSWSDELELENRNRRQGLSSTKHKTPNLEKILKVNKREARPNAMGTQGSEIFAVYLDIRAPSGGGGTTHAHYDHTLRKIRRLQLRQVQIPKFQFKVSADAIVERVAAEPFKALAPNIERRMRNHCGEPEHPRFPLRS